MTAPVSPMVTSTSQDGTDETSENSHSNSTSSTKVQVPKDFGFIPVPRHLQYDSTKPVHFGLLLNIGFGLACTFIVVNLYYCQPLLIQLSIAFDVSYSQVSHIPTLLQAGYAIGLVLITPLGDLIRRCQLLLTIITLSTCLSVGLAVTSSLCIFKILSFLVRVARVTPQILIPLAADLAPERNCAAAISIVVSGLTFGILLARVLAGIITKFTSWHVVYYFDIAVQGAVLVGCYFILPDYPSKNKDLTYWNILWTMAKFSVTEPILVQACLNNLASSATFTSFWVTLTFLLGGPPYHYSTLVIGLFALVEMVGVAMAPFVGHLIDNLVPWYATLFGILSIILVQAIQTGAGDVNVTAIIIVIVGLDLCHQMISVSLITTIFGISVSARARLNAVSLLTSFIGQVMGTSVSTQVFVKYGWRAAAVLNLGFHGFQLFILLLRGPHCKQYTWFGYEGGLEARKSVVDRRKHLEVERLLEPDSLSSEKIDNGNLIDSKGEISGTGDMEGGVETLSKRSHVESGHVEWGKTNFGTLTI